jgi:hypothetical protein
LQQRKFKKSQLAQGAKVKQTNCIGRDFSAQGAAAEAGSATEEKNGRKIRSSWDHYKDFFDHTQASKSLRLQQSAPGQQ